MSDPKLHHYVPQFYLRRFADADGQLWVWDRDHDRIFASGPRSVAAERDFYLLDELAENGHDPLTMERQLADLEGEVAAISGQWIDWVRSGSRGDVIPVPSVNREIVSLFIALQFLRTADARSLLTAVVEGAGYVADSKKSRRALHAEMFWRQDGVVGLIADRVKESTWIFGRNDSATPFTTSDNPVAFRTSDNRMWLKVGFLNNGTYAVYPLAPDVVMYCHPNEDPWRAGTIRRLDCVISPVAFTDEMVQSENMAHVFMASRFLFSNRPVFDAERTFAPTVGTDTYAPPGRRLFEADS
jgi:uncharacterized protein DUF4238